MKKWIILGSCLLAAVWASGQQNTETAPEKSGLYHIDGGISGEYKGKV